MKIKMLIIALFLTTLTAKSFAQEEQTVFAGDWVQDSFREHMIFAGDFVEKNRVRLGMAMTHPSDPTKNLEKYKQVVRQVRIIIVKEIVDPKLGILTARTTKDPSEVVGYYIELDQQRWKTMLEGKYDKYGANPYRLAFHEGALATGLLDVSGELSRKLLADDGDFISWKRKQYEVAKDDLKDRTFKFNITLFGPIHKYVEGQEDFIQSEAKKEFFQMYPRDWRKTYKQKLVGQMKKNLATSGNNLPNVIKIDVKRAKESIRLIMWPGKRERWDYAGKQGVAFMKHLPRQNKYNYVDLGTPKVGYQVSAKVEVKVWIDSPLRIARHHGRTVKGQAFSFDNKQVSLDQAISAKNQAKQSYLTKCELARQEIVSEHAFSPTEMVVFVNPCDEAPRESATANTTEKVAPQVYYDRRFEGDRPSLFYGSRMTDRSYVAVTKYLHEIVATYKTEFSGTLNYFVLKFDDE